MTRWIFSDPHFTHHKIVTFTDESGNLFRPFNDIEEHDETIISNCNKVINPTDKIYILGDVVMHKKNLHVVGRIKGHKTLIMGNHDIFDYQEYGKYFDNIRSYRIFNLPSVSGNVICSHIPLHPDCKGRFKRNIHGHLHHNLIKDRYGKPDPYYINVCLEHTNFGPKNLDLLLEGISREEKDAK